MAEFTHTDRCMIEAENSLWCAIEVLRTIEHCGSFSGRIAIALEDLESIARGIRGYNDDQESDE